MIGGEKKLASRKGAAEGVQGRNSAVPERSAGAKAVSFFQRNFAQSLEYPTNNRL